MLKIFAYMWLGAAISSLSWYYLAVKPLKESHEVCKDTNLALLQAKEEKTGAFMEEGPAA